MQAIDLSLKMDSSEGRSKEEEEEEEENGGESVLGDNHDPEVKEGCSDEVRSGVEVATAEANDAGEVEGRGEQGEEKEEEDVSIHQSAPQPENCDKYEVDIHDRETNIAFSGFSFSLFLSSSF